jgi:parallel beta-helix repeat protein
VLYVAQFYTEEINKMNNKMKQSAITLGVIVFGGMLTTAPVFAVSCGDPVSGIVDLNHNLNCHKTDGLVVTGNNTTINLHGFTISCTGDGYLGTCQRPTGNLGSLGYEGIKSSGFSGVTVNGTGTVSGFTIGIHLINGDHFTVNDVTVEGPYTPPFADNGRGEAVGIEVGLTNCPLLLSPANPNNSFSLTNNWVADQTIGIKLQFAQCGLVSNNIIERNAQGGPHGVGWGIEVINSTNNTLYKNSVLFNATGVDNGGGIHIAGGSTNTHVISNLVNLNCGNGILADGVSGNKVQTNTAQNNGVNWQYGQCKVINSGTYFDLAEVGSTSNLWATDNICDRKTQNIPSGVCK